MFSSGQWGQACLPGKGCHKEGMRSWQPRPGGHSLLIHVITATFDRAFPTTLHGMLSFPCFRLREGNFSHSSTPSQPPYQGQLTPPSQALTHSLQPPAFWLWLLRSEWLSVSCSYQNLWLTQAASKWQSPEVTQCFSDRLLRWGGWALAQKLLGTQADQGCQLQMLPRCPERVWGRGDGAAKLARGN